MAIFNIEPADKKFKAFCESHEFYNLIKSKTCFKSTSGSCIDLILTNKKHSFKNTSVIDVGLSDFHKMIFTQTKLTFEKLPPRTISFRDFKNFVKINFDDDLHKALTCNPQTRDDYGQFLQVFNNVSDKHAPLKKRLDRGNQKPFMNKTLRKAIMHRSKLLNAFNKTKKLQEWEKYRKQRNYCVKLKNKAKKQYFSKLGPCNMNRNNFWRTLGPFFFQQES